MTTGARWIDSHCHLQDRYRPADDEVLATVRQAEAAGVHGLVCVGTDADTSGQAVELAQAMRAAVAGDADPVGIWATVGLHPHEASAGVAGVADALERAVTATPGIVVAVGECGLDYHYDHSPRPAQRAAFAEQVALAKRHDLALVIHTREAWDDTIDILRREGPPERTVVHCFTGGPDEATRCLDLGAFLSFSGIVTFKGAPEVREAAVRCPADRLLVETDAPFLAPAPHRGKPNVPAWVTIVGAAVAEARGTPPDVLAASTTTATRAVFRLD